MERDTERSRSKVPTRVSPSRWLCSNPIRQQKLQGHGGWWQSVVCRLSGRKYWPLSCQLALIGTAGVLFFEEQVNLFFLTVCPQCVLTSGSGAVEQLFWRRCWPELVCPWCGISWRRVFCDDSLSWRILIFSSWIQSWSTASAWSKRECGAGTCILHEASLRKVNEVIGSLDSLVEYKAVDRIYWPYHDSDPICNYIFDFIRSIRCFYVVSLTKPERVNIWYDHGLVHGYTVSSWDPTTNLFFLAQASPMNLDARKCGSNFGFDIQAHLIGSY